MHFVLFFSPNFFTVFSSKSIVKSQNLSRKSIDIQLLKRAVLPFSILFLLKTIICAKTWNNIFQTSNPTSTYFLFANNPLQRAESKDSELQFSLIKFNPPHRRNPVKNCALEKYVVTLRNFIFSQIHRLTF